MCLMNGSGGEKGDTELFVDHEAEESHLGGTSLVQLNGTLGNLGLFIELLPAKVDETCRVQNQRVRQDL
jgi:hypothetical protein